MTSTQRILSRLLLAVLAVALSVLLAAPAHADVPEGWSNPEDVSALEALVILGAVPLVLFLLITLAVYLPAMMRGERVAPGAAAVESHWFGGPRGGTHMLEAGGGTTTPSGDTGGASGRW